MNKLPSREELIASGNEVAEKAWASVKTVPAPRNTGAIIPLGKSQLRVKVKQLENEIAMMDAAMRLARNAIRNAITAHDVADDFSNEAPLTDRAELELALTALTLHIKDSR